MRTIFIYLFALTFSYGLHAQDSDRDRAFAPTTGKLTLNIDFHKAASEGDISAVRDLSINFHSYINGTDEELNTPLHVACSSMPSSLDEKEQVCQEIISVLIRAGADVTLRNNREETPLHTLVKNRKAPLSSIEAMVQEGAGVNAVDASGNVPLHLIFNNIIRIRGRSGIEIMAIVDYLLQEGADINAVNNRGKAPLDNTTYYSGLRVVSHLLERGASVQIARASLHHAVGRIISRDFGEEERFEMTFRLLEAGADVKAVNERYQTPLHVATTREWLTDTVDLPLIFLLIQYGADVNVRDQGGRTPFLNMASLNSRQYDDFMEFLEWWPTQLKVEELFNNGLPNRSYDP